MIRHFVNLTNGIEAIEEHCLPGAVVEFIRISSTDCEHKLGNPQWDAILCELDTNLLMALARGDDCLVYDYSRGGQIPHALAYGFAWIRFALNLAWFSKLTRPVVIAGEDRSAFFTRLWWHETSKRAKAKLAYYRPFLTTEELHLTLISGRTKHDGNWGYFRRVLEDAGR